MYEVYYTFKQGKKIYADSKRFNSFEMAWKYANRVCDKDNIVHCTIFKRDLRIIDVL